MTTSEVQSVAQKLSSYGLYHETSIAENEGMAPRNGSHSKHCTVLTFLSLSFMLYLFLFIGIESTELLRGTRHHFNVNSDGLSRTLRYGGHFNVVLAGEVGRHVGVSRLSCATKRKFFQQPVLHYNNSVATFNFCSLKTSGVRRILTKAMRTITRPIVESHTQLDT